MTHFQEYEENKKIYGVTDDDIWDFAVESVVAFWTGFITQTTPMEITASADGSICDAERMKQFLSQKRKLAAKQSAVSYEQEMAFRDNLAGYLNGKKQPTGDEAYSAAPMAEGARRMMWIGTKSDRDGPAYSVYNALVASDIAPRDVQALFPVMVEAGFNKETGLTLGNDEHCFIAVPAEHMPQLINEMRPKPFAPQFGRPRHLPLKPTKI